MRSRIISTVSAVGDWGRWWAMSAVTSQAVWLKPPPPSGPSQQAVLQWWWNQTRWDRCHLCSHFHCLSRWFHHLAQRSEGNSISAIGYSFHPFSPFHLAPQWEWAHWEWGSVGGAEFHSVKLPNETHCDLIRWLNALLKKDQTAGIMENLQCLDALNMKIKKRSKRNNYITRISQKKNRKRLFMLSAAQSTKTTESHCNRANL